MNDIEPVQRRDWQSAATASITALALASLLLISCSRSGENAEPAAPAAVRQTLHFAPDDQPLVNPGKGWVLYGKMEQIDPHLLAVGSIGYVRFNWTALEPQEGVFDWSPIETQLAAWHAVGRQFAFGVYCADSFSDKPMTPPWVFAAGATCRKVTLDTVAQPYAGKPGVKVVPEFNDPVFLAKLQDFLGAMAARYDGDPRIAFIDIRSYGNWGEGHMYPFGGHVLTPVEFQQHVDLHLQAFHRTRLCISAAAKEHDAVYDRAASLGVAVRRDGVCGNSDGREVLRALGHAPGVFEFYGNYPWMVKQGWWEGKPDAHGYGHRLSDCVELGKPSYISLDTSPEHARELYAAERPLVDRLANRMGYLFRLQEAVVAATCTRGVPLAIDLTWRNDGVAPIYVPCALAVALLDDAGHAVEVVWPSGSAPATWQPAQNSHETVAPTFRSAPAGIYRLAVGLVAATDSQTPYVVLANAGRLATGWYPLTTVTVADP